jgi:hypothetical protein
MRKDREKRKRKKKRKIRERERSPGAAPPSFPCRWVLMAL